MLLGTVGKAEAGSFKSRKIEIGKNPTPTGQARQHTPTQKARLSKTDTYPKQTIKNEKGCLS